MGTIEAFRLGCGAVLLVEPIAGVRSAAGSLPNGA